MAARPDATPGPLRTAVAGPGDEDTWDAFVAGRPDASFCHLFGWREVIHRAYRKTTHSLYVADGRSWQGVLPLVHLRGPLTGNRLVSLPYLDQGGILANSAATAEALLDAALRLARELGASGLDLHGPTGLRPEPTGEATRFRFLLPLGDSEEQLWQKVGPKVRNQVRKSETCGLTTERVAADRLADFYAVFARNMRDLGSPVHSRRFFREILAVLDPQAGLYLTRGGDGSTVAGGIALRFADTVTVPWASSLRSARPTCPNHSLYWRVLRDARQGGAASFDFGRSSVGTGTYRFKKQWRTRPEPLRWEHYDDRGHPEEETYLDPRRNARLADLWRRLPLSAANRLGPWVRRQLAN